MGLDTTHDCWHGAYSAFGRWRQKLAQLAGLPPLDFMEGFWGGIGDEAYGIGLSFKVDLDTLKRHVERVHPEAYSDKYGGPGDHVRRFFSEMQPIRWDALKPDVLHVLLHHSDCDGVIEHKHCKPLAARLAELLPLLPDEEAGGHIGHWREKTQTFIDGLMRAHEAGEPVEFH